MDELEVDARGRPCPIPIIEAAKAMARLEPGQVLALRGTDPAMAADLRAWCQATGHELLSLEQAAHETRGRVRKRAPSP